MKLTKLTLILCAAAQLATARLVGAQDSPTPTPTFAPMLPPPKLRDSLGKRSVSDVLSRMLSLTDAQKMQLQPYFKAVQSQFDATHQQARQAQDVLVKQLYSSIRLLLTPEQQTKLDAIEAMRVGVPPSNPVGVGLMFGKDFGGASQ
jgi:Spy/CpxP family protein refolding chaperone